MACLRSNVPPLMDICILLTASFTLSSGLRCCDCCDHHHHIHTLRHAYTHSFISAKKKQTAMTCHAMPCRCSPHPGSCTWMTCYKQLQHEILQPLHLEIESSFNTWMEGWLHVHVPPNWSAGCRGGHLSHPPWRPNSISQPHADSAFSWKCSTKLRTENAAILTSSSRS